MKYKITSPKELQELVLKMGFLPFFKMRSRDFLLRNIHHSNSGFQIRWMGRGNGKGVFREAKPVFMESSFRKKQDL